MIVTYELKFTGLLQDFRKMVFEGSLRKLKEFF